MTPKFETVCRIKYFLKDLRGVHYIEMSYLLTLFHFYMLGVTKLIIQSLIMKKDERRCDHHQEGFMNPQTTANPSSLITHHPTNIQIIIRSAVCIDDVNNR
jgi:hypothetical protein